MWARYGHTQCVAHHFLEHDPWLRTATRFHHQRNVNAPVEQCTFKVVAGEIQKRHAHARRSCLKCRQRAWENFSCRRRRVTDTEFTGLAASQRTNGLQSLVGAGKPGACFIGEEFSGFGEFDPTCAALKQFHAKLSFEILDLPTQRRLSDVKPLRRLRHVAKLGDGCEITQMAKFHTTAYPKSIAGSGTRYWEGLKLWSNKHSRTGREYEDTYSTKGDRHGRFITRTC